MTKAREQGGGNFQPVPFASRAVKYYGLTDWQGWRLKTYLICKPGDRVDSADLERGLEDIDLALPQPPLTSQRPGAGILIFHQGQEFCYIVIGWWQNENELVTRVYIRDRSGPQDVWIYGDINNSFCVWDLEIMWKERNAYIEHILNSEKPADIEAYLENPVV